MKSPARTTAPVLLALALFAAATARLQAQDPAVETQPVPAPQQESVPHSSNLPIVRDRSPLPAGGTLQMSYANVVDKILPSVVTVYPKAVAGRGMQNMEEDIERIPPALRPFFYRFFGIPEDSDPFEEQENQRPQRRPREAPPEQPRREQPRQTGVGSGVILSEDGLIMTNNHVIDGADEIEVSIENGTRKSYKAKVIGSDPLTDVALIKVDASGLKPATIGDSQNLRVGDVVLAAGAPMQLNLSVTQGIVSALGRSSMGIVGGRGNRGYEDFIQTDAAINPGNSGGPLVDAMGRVIGINTAIISRSGMSGGIGFAIPINMALDVAADLIESGAVRRGYLGVQIRDVAPDEAEMFELTEEGGALVTMVGGDSPAARAGVEVEDVIVKADGVRVDSSARLRLVVSSRKPGSRIPLEVIRHGQRITLEAELEELPVEALAGGPGTIPRGQAPAANNEIIPGLRATELTAALRKENDIPGRVNGLLVTEVAPNSGAAKTGIQKGDVIQEINRSPVENLKQAREVIRAGGDQRIVRFRIYRDGDSMLAMVNIED
jgi:serine protease Do